MRQSKTPLGILLLLTCFAFAPIEAALAEVELQDGVKLRVLDDEIDVGDNFEIEITLQEPDEDEVNANGFRFWFLDSGFEY